MSDCCDNLTLLTNSLRVIFSLLVQGHYFGLQELYPALQVLIPDRLEEPESPEQDRIVH
jgi:hypothetical protein